MTIKALIFDFDGMIIDTESTEYRAWQEVYAEHGCELPIEVWADCIGRPSGYFSAYDHLAGLLGREIDSDAIRARRRARSAELNALQSARPGILAYLDEAKQRGIALAIASSADRTWVRDHLDRLGLRDRFACIRCVEDTAVHKPAPEPYLSVLRHFGLPPGEAVAFEDSPNGIASAKAAGVFCVAVPNPITAMLDLSAADLQVPSLADLPLARLLAILDEERRVS